MTSNGDKKDLANNGLHLEETATWALDVVCGMEVDPTTTTYHSDYKGDTYYFCNESCMTHFIHSPANYVG